MHRVISTVVVLVAACSSGSKPGGDNQPLPPPGAAAPDASAPVVTAAPDAAPAVVAGQCNADARHCCMADGTLVVPGGCQPSYPDNVQPATDRAPDGYCVRIECHKKCLPATAKIATPRGEVLITELGIGDRVWSIDERGEKIEARVVDIGWQAVIGKHEIVEVTLDDGRVTRASAGHPLADGGTVGDLVTGVAIDGATVKSVKTVPYDGERTWDLLPDGPTGVYWADGVLLGSTLAVQPGGDAGVQRAWGRKGALCLLKALKIRTLGPYFANF